MLLGFLMKIAALECQLYRIPLLELASDATHGVLPHFELVTVRVAADDGAQGTGYTMTVGAGGAAVARLIATDLAPLLCGLDPRRIEHVWQRMWWHLHYVGRGGVAAYAISAVDLALWDLRGRLLGEPLWRLLGGHDPRVPAYGSGTNLAFSLEALIEQNRVFLARGLRAVKMKVGRPRLAEDLERVAAVRALVGPDVALLVDANMRWDVNGAIRAARALAEYDVYWLEEPTVPEDVEGHARVLREGRVPIAAGENYHTVAEFKRLLDAGGVSFPDPDVTNVGGITAWLRVAHLAEAYHCSVTIHGLEDLHVHLLAAVPNRSYLAVGLLNGALERYKRHHLTIEEGLVQAPDRPGHGLEFDLDALRPYRAAF